MPQPDQQIVGLLMGRLQSLPSLPPIAYENVPFTAPADKRYLRPTVMFGDQSTLSILNGSSVLVAEGGLFLVDCFGDVGKGRSTVDALAAAVRNHFRPGLLLQGTSGASVRLGNNSRAEGRVTPEGDVPAYFVPVTIEWRCSYRAG